MDYRILKRDAAKIHTDLVKQGDDQYVTQSGCVIIIPKRYIEKQLANYVGQTTTLACFAIALDSGAYGVAMVDSVLRLANASVTEQSYDDIKYLEFRYEPGAVVIENTAMVCNNKLPYLIYNEFVAKGKIPWFLDYTDVGRMFDTAKAYAGLDLKTNHAIFELLAAVMARNPKSRAEFLRTAVGSQAELLTTRPVFVAFRNIQAQATNTTTKLMGSYFRDALPSALVNPSERLEGFEKLLRL